MVVKTTTRPRRRSMTTTTKKKTPIVKEGKEKILEEKEKDDDHNDDDDDDDNDDVTRKSKAGVKPIDDEDSSGNDEDEEVTNENEGDKGGNASPVEVGEDNDEEEVEQETDDNNDDDDDDDDLVVAGDGITTHDDIGDKKKSPTAKVATPTASTDDSKASKGKNNRKKKKTSSSLRKTTTDNTMRNPLTKLIPGYTAPMMLNTSLLDKYRPQGGIIELQRRAERTDASTKDFVIGTAATAKHIAAMKKTSQGFLPKSYTEAYSSFQKGVKRPPDNTAGKGWFGMIPTPMTEELKTDLAVIRNRAYLDPKRFYKSSDKHHKIVQLGTVIEGPSEYYSSRLTKKQRRSNFTEEIMADHASADYTTNKFKQMSREKTYQAQRRQPKPKRVKKFY